MNLLDEALTIDVLQENSQKEEHKEKVLGDFVPHPNYRFTKLLFDTSPFVTVFEAIWTGSVINGYVKTNDKVIVKRCNSLGSAHNEIQILERLMHKTNVFQDFFMKLIFVYEPNNTKEIDLVIQYGGQDTFELLIHLDYPSKFLTKRLKNVSEIITKLMICVIKLHTLRLVHNDIKPENIVARKKEDGTWNVNLIDFAISSHAIPVNDVVGLEEHVSNGKKFGSEFYMHPHILWNKPLHLYQNDLWAIGQTCFRLYTQACIYDPETYDDEIKYRTLNVFLLNPNWHEEIQCSIDLVQHPSFKMFARFVSKMCCASKAPQKAEMCLLQDPFLCYWTNYD